ncbi:MAG: ferredoxin [Fibrobacteria bacterium]|nr:ferredoxin [Fibrobacteria bacterium]
MAEKDKKVPENVEGPWFVDSECSACQLCTSTAPENFKMTEDESSAYVFKQPSSPEEEDACKEAADDCPEGAIGSP